MLQIHPDDARSAGVGHGDQVTVHSRAGRLTVAVEVTDDLRRGVVSLPHGFGHDLDGVDLGVARQRGGVNSNVLTDRFVFDPICGNAVLNGIPVELTPA